MHVSEFPPPPLSRRPPPPPPEPDQTPPGAVEASDRAAPSIRPAVRATDTGTARSTRRRGATPVNVLVVRSGGAARIYRATGAALATVVVAWLTLLLGAFGAGIVGHGVAAMPDPAGFLTADATSAGTRSLRAAFSFAPPSHEPTVVARASARAHRLQLGTLMAAGELIGGRPRASWVEAAGSDADITDTLRWPVPRGWFVRGYGSGEGGYHRAVDVAGEIGSDVIAAATGIVGYSGNQVRGYGNLVLLVHPGGWVTSYAHNSRNLVVAGQRVRAGQVIAQVGSTGISRGPHVHFELRYRGLNCDPAPLFRPAVLHRNGAISELTTARWSPLERRPRAVECGMRRRHPGYRRESNLTAVAHAH